MTKERIKHPVRKIKVCPSCDSCMIRKLTGVNKSKHVPDNLQKVPHYKCDTCKHRFTEPHVRNVKRSRWE